VKISEFSISSRCFFGKLLKPEDGSEKFSELSEIQSVTTQKTVLFIVTAVSTSNAIFQIKNY
jgi:hypothetical protein